MRRHEGMLKISAANFNEPRVVEISAAPTDKPWQARR